MKRKAASERLPRPLLPSLRERLEDPIALHIPAAGHFLTLRGFLEL